MITANKNKGAYPAGGRELPHFYSSLNKGGLRGVKFLFVLFVFSLSLFGGLSFAAQDMTGLLKDFIRDNYPWAEVDLSGLRLSGEVPEELPQKVLVEKAPPGRAVFILEYGSGRKVVATANVKAFDRIVMSRRSLRKGHCLDDDDLYITMVESGRVPKEAVRDIGDAAGKVLTRSIISNAPLVESMISEKPEVRKGKRVMLVAASKGFSITAVGEMKESGYVGNYLRAVNLASKKTITGLLIDENTLKVEF